MRTRRARIALLPGHRVAGGLAGASILWLLGLAIALAASEALVHGLTSLGRHIHLATVLLGFLIALGADGPEITSALIALTRGSTDVGAGVLLGSNIYNLAGLLGLSALLGGSLGAGRRWITPDAAVNIGLTLLALGILAWAAAHRLLNLLLSVLLLGAFGAYIVLATRRSQPKPEETATAIVVAGPVHSLRLLIAILAGSVVLIIAGSDTLVQTSLYLGPRLDIPSTVVGSIVLAVATSLPNTWAAISLTRRHLGTAAIAATFSSNSINLAAGIAAPSLFLTWHVRASVGSFSSIWLLGMTVLAIALLGVRHQLSRFDGLLLLGAYAGFVCLRLTVVTS